MTRNPQQSGQEEPHIGADTNRRPGRLAWLWDASLIGGTAVLIEAVLHYVEQKMGFLPDLLSQNIVHSILLLAVLVPLIAWRIWARSNASTPAHAMRFGAKSPHRRVRTAIWASLVLIGVLVTSEVWASQQLQKRSRLDAETINLAGRQRMLSQRIARGATQAMHASADTQQDHIDMIREAEARLNREARHIENRLQTLQDNGDTHVLGAIVAFDSIAMARIELTEAVSEFETALQRDEPHHWAAAEASIHKASDLFLLRMEDGVSQLQAHAEQSLDERLAGQNFILAALLSLLLMIALLVVEPIVRLIRREYSIAEANAAEFEKLAMVAQRTKNSVVTLDPQGRITWVNEGFEELTEYSAADAIGAMPAELFYGHWTDDDVRGEIDQAIREQHAFDGEIRCRSKHGRRFWKHINMQPHVDKDGNVIGFLVVETDVTELLISRERAEQTLQELGAWRTAVDRHALFSVADAQGKIIEVNDQFCEVSGYSRDELVGQTHQVLCAGVHSDSFWSQLWETISSGTVWRDEICNRHKDGSLYWVDTTIVPIINAEGDVQQFVSLRVDITARKNSEIAIQKAQADLARVQGRFERAVDGSSDGLWDYEPDSGNVWYSDRFCQLLGFDGNSDSAFPPVVESWSDRLHPDDRDATLAALDAHMRGEAPYDVTYRLEMQDGSYRWFHARGQAICDEQGNVTRVSGSLTDIESQVRSQQELATIEQQLRMFVKHTPAAVAMFDNRMRYLVASRGWYEQYNLTEEDVRGRSHYDIFTDLPAYRRAAHLRALSGETLSADRDVLMRADGTKTWSRWQLSPWHQTDGSIGGVIMFTAEINDQIEHEQRLQEARQAAEAANVAKTEFLANMSHEIRTPMTAILGYTDLLAEAGSDDTIKRADYIETIRRNGEHLLDVINDVLDISKIEAGKMSVESIATRPVDLVREVMELMSVKADAKGLSLAIEIDGTIPREIASDPVRLRQILVNLVGNATKFTEIGGIRIRLACDAETNRMRFEVHDTGIGIEPGGIRKLFDSFSQADTSMARRFGGTGLGLPISQRFARLLGGDISATSEPGKGSCFVVTVSTGNLENVQWCDASVLDRNPSSSNESDDERAIGDTMPLDGVHILLAEDGLDNQRLIKFHLQKAGAEVTIAENGAEAMRRVTHDGSLDGPLCEEFPYDLVLTDMQMPEMDGYELAGRLRAGGHTGPIVALTAHAMGGDRDRCIAAGCNEYATKPIDRAALVQVILSLLPGHASRRAA